MLRVIGILLVIVLLVGIAFEIAYTIDYMSKGFDIGKAVSYAWNDITGFVQRLFNVKAEYMIDIEYPMANTHIVWDNTHK